MPKHVMNFWTAALVAVVFFVGCSQAEGPAESGSSHHLLGRYSTQIQNVDTRNEDISVALATGYQMGWPGSGIAFSFEGKNAALPIEDSGQGIMDVVINGEKSQLELKSGKHLYPIVTSKERTLFDVRVTRRTEFYDTGLFTIDRPVFMSLEGDALPEPKSFIPQDRKILFLGDSITAGFGVAGDTKDCANTPALHSPTESYAMLTADMFDAEPQLIAISGRGVVHNWDANPAPVMPFQIDFALPDESDGLEWDHSRFMPDVVVTLLGTNDWSVINPGQDKFRKGYRDLLEGIRQRFPEAHIATIGGPLLGGEQGAAIRDGIDWAMADLDDANISTLDLTLYDGALKWSCDYHPGRNSMRKMANELSEHISEVKRWNFEPLSMPPKHAISPPDYMWPDGKAHFKSRLPEIDAQPILEGGVMLAGDSITEGWLGYNIDLGMKVSNHGIGWDTLTGLKARLPQMLRHSPDKVFILIGTNDIGYRRDPGEMIAEMRDIIAAFKTQRPKTKIYIQSILPRETDVMTTVESLNEKYKNLALEMNVSYLDLTPVFAAPNGTLKSRLTYDGLHLNEVGYNVWAEALKPYILD